MASVARTIVEEAAASDAVDNCRNSYARFDELWTGWVWRLARDPLAEAYEIPGSKPSTYLVKSGNLSNYGLPTITVMYRFTDDEVNIISVKVTAPPKPPGKATA